MWVRQATLESHAKKTTSSHRYKIAEGCFAKFSGNDREAVCSAADSVPGISRHHHHHQRDRSRHSSTIHHWRTLRARVHVATNTENSTTSARDSGRVDRRRGRRASPAVVDVLMNRLRNCFTSSLLAHHATAPLMSRLVVCLLLVALYHISPTIDSIFPISTRRGCT